MNRFLICLVCLAMAGCDRFTNLSPADLTGIYVYIFRTGEVEEITLTSDMTFHQALFSSRQEFVANRNGGYLNHGLWTHERGNISLRMFEFADLETMSVRKKPVILYDSGGLGWMPGWSNTKHPVLLRAEDLGYIMQWLPRREDIVNCTWHYPLRQ